MLLITDSFDLIDDTETTFAEFVFVVEELIETFERNHLGQKFCPAFESDFVLRIEIVSIVLIGEYFETDDLGDVIILNYVSGYLD